MMKILIPVTLGVTLIAAGCTHDAHEHEEHMSMDGDHKTMMEGHDHESMSEHHKDSGHMKDDHMDAEPKDGGHMSGAHEHRAMASLAGKPGLATEVKRSIEVTADDTMRFMHQPLNINDGETVKFVITNKGAVPHEFAIGTKDEHEEHGQMMMNNPNMHHGPGGNAITVAPGETAELIWTFENAWQIEVACNIPGHYQAGMHSAVEIKE